MEISQFRNKFDTLIKPHFYSIKYHVNTVTTHNTLTIDYEKFIQVFKECKTAAFYVCLVCHISLTRVCKYCTLFLQYPRAFILKTPKRLYCMPQPSLYTKKNYSYFQSIVWFIYKVNNTNEFSNTDVPQNLQYPKRLLYRQAPLFRIPKHIIDMEHLKYYQFMNDKFKGGSLMQQKSGKLSYMRVRILGVNALGVRMTLTIDNNLGPNEVSIPRDMLNCLDLATPYVIINRDPSINDCSIYACELLSYRNTNDNTIHINPYVLEGLHADQDGDDLNVYYLKRERQVPSFLMSRAINELLRLSWKYGKRRNTSNECKYSFGQYHMLLLQIYDGYFRRESAIWNTLSRKHVSIPKRTKILMQLGSTIWRDEIDDFIDKLKVFGSRIRLNLTTINEMINGTGILVDIIKSGAKGSPEHIQMFTDMLQERLEIGKAGYISSLQQSFNNYVNASKSISLLGQQLFILLSVFQPLYLLSDDIYIKNDTRIIVNVSKSPFFSKWVYQFEAVTLLFDELLSTIDCDNENEDDKDIFDDKNIVISSESVDELSKNTIVFSNGNDKRDDVFRYFDSTKRTMEIGSSINFSSTRYHNILYTKYGNYVCSNRDQYYYLPMLYERICDYIDVINSSDLLHDYLVNDSSKIVPIYFKLPDTYKTLNFKFLRTLQ